MIFQIYTNEKYKYMEIYTHIAMLFFVISFI